MVLKILLQDLSYTIAFSVVAATVAWLVYLFLGCGRLLLGAWCCVEVLFFALQRWRYHDLNRVNKHPPSAHDVDQRIRQFLTLREFVDIRDFFSGWFLGIAFSEIRRGNVADFIAYAYWYKPRASLSEEEQAAVLEYTRLIEETWSVHFPEGYNDKLQLMEHLWQPLRVVHKPLFVHLASEGSMLVTHLCLQGLGFTRYQCMGFTYWVKGLPEPSSVDEERGSWLTRPSGRMTLLQGVLRDFRNLLPESLLPWPVSVEGVARGPFDFLASLSLPQLQGVQEYRARLQGALHHLSTLPRSLPSFNDLSALSADMQQSLAAGVRSATDMLPALQPLPPVVLERINAARDRIPALQHELAQQLAAARAALPALPGHDVPGRFAAAAREVLHTLPTVPEMRGAAERQFASARGRLPGLPSLPDGVRQQLAAARDCFPPLERRIRRIASALAEATSTVMQCAEFDGFFVRLTPEVEQPAPVDDMTATVEAWIAAARSTLEAAGSSSAAYIRGASSAAFSGVSLPCYTDLLSSCPQLMGPAELLSSASYALRQAVESALLDRTASGLVASASDVGTIGADVLEDLPFPPVRTSSETARMGSSELSPLHVLSRSGNLCDPSFGPVPLPPPPALRRRSLKPSGFEETSSVFLSQDSGACASSVDWSTADWADLGSGAASGARAGGCGGDAQEATSKPSAPPGLTPICFLHGVGFGVFPYLGFVWKLLTAFNKRPFILLEVRHVSLRLCMRALGVDDVVRALAEVLRRHEVSVCNFVGHSFGTFVIAHIRKLFPETVGSVLLCDPVCMLTCFPKLLYNFIYKGVSLDEVLKNPADAGRYLAARDLIIAETFCRHFWWHTLMLWPDELPDPSVLVLSGKDDLVPSLLVSKMLQAAPEHVKVLYHPDLYHGHFLFNRAWQDTIVKTFKEALEKKQAQYVA